MKLTPAVQEAILVLLFHDREAGGIVASSVKAEEFDPVFTDLATEAIEYRRRYKRPPGEHAQDLVDQLKKRVPKNADLYEELYESIVETRDGPGFNPEFVLKQVSAFIGYQRLKRGMADAIDELEEETEEGLLKAQAAIRGALEPPKDLGFDVGTLFSDPKKSLRFYDRSGEVFLCGIPEMDTNDLGPARGELWLYVAPTGSGKTWKLLDQVKQAWLQRLRVVYITLELAESLAAERLVQSFYGLSRRQMSRRRLSFRKDDLGRFMAFDVKDFAPDFLSAKGKRSELVKRLKSVRRPPVLKGFPAYSLTVGGIDAYLDLLEARERIVPDVVVVDYADYLKPTNHYSERRFELEAIYLELRGMAQRRNLAMVTASQSKAIARKQRLITAEDAGEAYSKSQIADVVCTYSQTPLEKSLGLARLFMAKARTGPDGYQILISQDYSVGAYCVDSCRMNSDYWKQLKGMDEGGGPEEIPDGRESAGDP